MNTFIVFSILCWALNCNLVSSADVLEELPIPLDKIERDFKVLNIENLTDINEIDLTKLNVSDFNFNTKIVNGFPAGRYQIPYQVAIYVYGIRGDIFFCGGSLISPTYVLTAGHCIFDTPARILVILGNENLNRYSRYETRIDVSRYIVHYSYDSIRLVNDICLLELKRPVQYNAGVQPIKLPSYSDIYRSYVERNALVSGFGKTYDAGQVVTQLMYAKVRIMDNNQCSPYFHGGISSGNVCSSGFERIGPCQGDSGGPLAMDGKIIGIVSFGSNYCTQGYPTVYTRVTSYLKWINFYTKIPIY